MLSCILFQVLMMRDVILSSQIKGYLTNQSKEQGLRPSLSQASSIQLVHLVLSSGNSTCSPPGNHPPQQTLSLYDNLLVSRPYMAYTERYHD